MVLMISVMTDLCLEIPVPQLDFTGQTADFHICRKEYVQLRSCYSLDADMF